MKKYFIIILSLIAFSTSNSCSERDLFLPAESSDPIDAINSEDRMQMFLNSGYIAMGSSSTYGTDLMVFGDLLGDKMFVTNANPQFAITSSYAYNADTNDFGFYGKIYDAIMNCNLVINTTGLPPSENISRIKAEAKILRAMAYFTLVNYYSPTPTSGVNQEYGVPLVLGNYDSTIVPARASVAEIYSQIIADLNDGLIHASDIPQQKVLMSKTAAKLLLAKVYLTRRAAGDAELALGFASDIVNNPSARFAPVEKANYPKYFGGNGSQDADAENQAETIWELDMNQNTNNLTGVGANTSLPGYLYRVGDRKCLMFRKGFYDSFPDSDIRKGTPAAGLLTPTGASNADSPMGVWTNKYPRFTSGGNFVRNIKVLRFADAQLSRIEALHLTGQNALALTELNEFAASRNGSTYTGADLLEDILTERAKEFYGEGQRFLDLKRYNKPISKESNCTACSVPANDKLFVLPMSENALNYNPNLTQYPGY